MKSDKSDETSNDVYIPKLNSQIMCVQRKKERVQNNASKSKHSVVRKLIQTNNHKESTIKINYPSGCVLHLSKYTNLSFQVPKMTCIRVRLKTWNEHGKLKSLNRAFHNRVPLYLMLLDAIWDLQILIHKWLVCLVPTPSVSGFFLNIVI